MSGKPNLRHFIIADSRCHKVLAESLDEAQEIAEGNIPTRYIRNHISLIKEDMRVNPKNYIKSKHLIDALLSEIENPRG